MEQAKRSVRVIPPTIDPKARFLTAAPTAKRRVAGYARVSTSSEEQLTSYEAQVDYYTRFIQARADWEFVKVYTDEGISAVNTRGRDGFNRMLQDALAGKIDLIITKSVSRFARNTVDSLTAVRKLKEKGVEVYFEKENIYTLDSKGELLITIMSSLAQEESRSISENVTWGQRKRFADGKVSMPYKRFLGYDKGADGLPMINEKEAEVVRRIYRLYLEGKTASGICGELEAAGIPTPAGKQKWSQTTVNSILRNEKYKGDALLQKRFTVDFLEKKMKPNEGEVPQYYVENSHPAIISAEEFDLVQQEIERRKRFGRSCSGSSALASKLICADCGGFYGQKVWHSTDRYRRVVYQCNAKFKNERRCSTPHLEETRVQAMFLKAYDTLMGDRESVIADCEAMRAMLCDCRELDTEIRDLDAAAAGIAGQIQLCISKNAASAQDQEEYARGYNALAARYEETMKRRDSAMAKRAKLRERDEALRLFLEAVRQQPLILQRWDERVWNTLLESGTVCRDGSIRFLFRNGVLIEVPAPGAR